jgi:hypothetical protein
MAAVGPTYCSFALLGLCCPSSRTGAYAERVFLIFWDFAAAGGFLTAAFAAWASLRSAFQTQFDEALPKLAAVPDSTL